MVMNVTEAATATVQAVQTAAIKHADKRLIPDWRRAWRFLSLQISAINAAFLATWALLPDDIKAGLPSWLVPFAGVMLLLVGMGGRLYKQKAPEGN